MRGGEGQSKVLEDSDRMVGVGGDMMGVDSRGGCRVEKVVKRGEDVGGKGG